VNLVGPILVAGKGVLAQHMSASGRDTRTRFDDGHQKPKPCLHWAKWTNR